MPKATSKRFAIRKYWVCCTSEVIWERPMGIEYRERSPAVPGFEPPRARFSHSGILAVLVIAAIPAALGTLQQLRFGIADRSVESGGENAAATAYASGNQPPKPALAHSANAPSAAKGDVLALCSGNSGAIPDTRLSCMSLPATIQH
jgi:hypothetical protein